MEQQKNVTENQASFGKVNTTVHDDDKKSESYKARATDSESMKQARETGHRPSWMDEDTSEIQPNPPKPEQSQVSNTNTRPSWMDEDTSEIQPNPPKAVFRKTSAVQTHTSWMDEDTSEIQPNPPKISNCRISGTKNRVVWVDEVMSDLKSQPPKITTEEQLSETELGRPDEKEAKLKLLKKPKVFIIKSIDDAFGNVVRMAIKWFINLFCHRK